MPVSVRPKPLPLQSRQRGPSRVLDKLDPEDVFIVHRMARNIADGIARERAYQSADMVDVIRTLNAVLEPLIGWLRRHGVDASLRRTQ